MKTNRKTMLIAALVVAVVALAGVGYAAATGYKATTSVTTNDVNDSQYLLIKTGDNEYTQKFSGSYAFNTTNTAGAVTFDDCYDISTTETITAQSTAEGVDAYFTYSNNAYAFENTTANATHKAYDVGSVTIVIDNSYSSGNPNVTLSIKGGSNNTFVTGNQYNIALVFTYTIGPGTETLFTPDTTGVTTSAFAATNNVVVKAYLVVPNTAVAIANITGATAEFEGTLDFVATAAASA